MVNPKMAEHILSIDNLSKSFEGNQVFNDISFPVATGELSSIIGPNGAGKTTLFNLVTGYHVPDTGKIFFKGKNIAGMEPFDIVRLGIARAFQFAGELGAKFHNPNLSPEETRPYTQEDTGYREFKLKLSKVKDRMLTAEGRRMAEERHAFMEKYFERFFQEYEGEK